MSYDPTIGRFLEEDPAGYIDGPNRYQIEGSNPINRVDPTGLDWWDVGGQILQSNPVTDSIIKVGSLITTGSTSQQTQNEFARGAAKVIVGTALSTGEFGANPAQRRSRLSMAGSTITTSFERTALMARAPR